MTACDKKALIPFSHPAAGWEGEQEQGILSAALPQPSHSVSNIPKSCGVGLQPLGASSEQLHPKAQVQELAP